MINILYMKLNELQHFRHRHENKKSEGRRGIRDKNMDRYREKQINRYKGIDGYRHINGHTDIKSDIKIDTDGEIDGDEGRNGDRDKV